MLQIVERRRGSRFQLADLTPQLTRTGLRADPGAGFDFAKLRLEMDQLLHRVFNFLGELLPARRQPGNVPDGARHLNLGPVEFAPPPASHFLVAERNGIQFLDQLLMALVQRDHLDEFAAHFGLLLGVGGTAFFHVSEVYEIVQLFVAMLQKLSDLHHAQLNQSRAADGFLHAQFPALHAPRQVYFTFAG